MPVPTPKLTDDLKTYVVERLAGFDSPGAIANALKKEHGIDIARQSVEAYDPTKRAGRKLAKEWKTLFNRTREMIIAGKAKVGASNKMVRVRWRGDMAQRAMDAGNLPLANEILDSVAKEMGDGFSNRREISGPGGKPIEVHNVYDLSDDELAAIASQGRGGTAAPAEGAAKPDRVRKRNRNPGKAGQ